MRLYLLLLAALPLLAAEQHGTVRFGGLPVPGAAVVVEKGGQTFTAITDQQGVYTFPDLPDGTWKMHIEMLGFAPLQQDLTAVAGAPSPELELKMLPFADMRAEVRLAVAPLPDPTPAAPAPGKPAPGKPAPAKPAGAKPAGFQRTEVNASTTPAATNTQEPQPAIASAAASSSDLAQRAADGFLVNGSVNNGAASPFAQLA